MSEVIQIMTPLPVATLPALPPGGISPITRDFVNPEKPWPHLRDLSEVTAEAGFELLPRLPVYPEFLGLFGSKGSSRRVPGEVLRSGRNPKAQRSSSDADLEVREAIEGSSHQAWLDERGGRESVRAAALRLSDSSGYVRGAEEAALRSGER